MTKTLPDHNTDAVLKAIFDEFEKCVTKKPHPFSSFTYATVEQKSNRKHNLPRVRTMILRHWLSEQKALIIYTDKRSDKVEHLEKNPYGELMFYDRETLVQVRCLCAIEAIDYKTLGKDYDISPDIEEAKVYKTDQPPGTPVQSKEVGFNSEAEEMFCALICRIREIDWVLLDDENGNKRAGYLFDDSGSLVESGWRVP